MLCPHCYAEIPDDMEKCSACGKSLEGVSPVTYIKDKENSYTDDIPEGETSYALSPIDYIKRPFMDPQAPMKVLIGSALSLVPVVGQVFVGGYYIEYARKIINRDDSENLPQWDNWSEIGLTGLLLLLAGIIYFAISAMITTVATIPFWATIVASFGKLAKQSRPDTGTIIAILSSLIIPLTIASIIAIVIGLIFPILQMIFAKNGNFASLFNIGGALGIIFGNIVEYLVTILVLIGTLFVGSLAVGLVVSLINFIPFVGQIITFLINMIFSFAFGLVSISAFGEFYYKCR